MEVEEIGTIEAILASIKTKVDGSCSISFEVNPENIHTINRLMQLYLIGEKLFTLGIVRSIGNNELSDV